MAGSGGIVAEQTGLERLVDGVLQTSGGKWVLASDVDPAVFGAGGEPAMVRASMTANGSFSIVRSLKVPGSDSSRLATTCFGQPCSAATARHLMPVGKAAPPAARQARIGDGGAHGLRTHLDGGRERLVPAVGAVSRGSRVDHTDALQQAKRLVALLVEQFIGRVVGGHGVGATDPWTNTAPRR